MVNFKDTMLYLTESSIILRKFRLNGMTVSCSVHRGNEGNPTELAIPHLTFITPKSYPPTPIPLPGYKGKMTLNEKNRPGVQLVT